MSLSALAGIKRLEKSHKKAPKNRPISRDGDAIPRLKVKPAKAPEPIHFEDNAMDNGDQILRTPRVTPVRMKFAVDQKSTGLAMTDPLGAKRETQERREVIVEWMLDGHSHHGKLMSVTELAEALAVPMECVERDIIAIKKTFETFYTENNVRDVTALAYMLMEMKLQDRGRALALYNIIRGDIAAADENAVEVKNKMGQTKKLGMLTGRDRASMYSAMLSALDMANKSTNGIDNLIKLSGGFQKLQQVIHAKSVQINNGNGIMASADQLQEFAAQTLACVLPSTRKVRNIKDIPASIDLTEEDRAIMAIGEKERGDK